MGKHEKNAKHLYTAGIGPFKSRTATSQPISSSLLILDGFSHIALFPATVVRLEPKVVVLKKATRISGQRFRLLIRNSTSEKKGN